MMPCHTWALRPRAHCNLFIGGSRAAAAAARKVNFLSHPRRRGFKIHRPQRLFKIQQASREGGYINTCCPKILLLWPIEHLAQFGAPFIKPYFQSPYNFQNDT